MENQLNPTIDESIDVNVEKEEDDTDPGKEEKGGKMKKSTKDTLGSVSFFYWLILFYTLSGRLINVPLFLCSLSQGRKAAAEIINRLCLTFDAPEVLKIEMQNLLRDKKLKCGRFEVMAYAIFYYIISSQRFITIKEVANAASSKAEREEEAKQQKGKQKKRGKKAGSLITTKDITLALKNLEKHNGPIINGPIINKPYGESSQPGPSCEAITFPQWVMPVISTKSLVCPFTYKDVGGRVLDLTKKVLEITYRRCTCKPALTFMPLAASYLAYQSCFFYRSPNCLPEMRVKSPAIKVGEFLSLIGFEFKEKELNGVRKSLGTIRGILKDVLSVTDGIPEPSREGKNRPIETTNIMSIRYLDEILSGSEESIKRLIKKEEEGPAVNTPPLHKGICRNLKL